jgi:hypothetical protein
MTKLPGIAMLAALAASTACMDSVTAVDDAPEAPPIRKLEVGEEQGRYLLGANLDGRGDGDLHWSVASAAVQADGTRAVVTVVGAELYASTTRGGYRGDDDRFIGMTFIGAFGGEMRITAVHARTATPRYRIELRGDGDWSDPCDGGPAIALDGTFTRRGVHNDTAGRLTFACDDGVASKCTAWGYIAGASDADPRWDLHQTCTRMARNDICGTGESGTREGTRIEFRDDSLATSAPPPPVSYPNPPVWPPPPHQFYFEGSWDRTGAVCLSKQRWQSVDLDPCATQIKDPRIDPDGMECDDLTVDDMRDRGALLYSSSLFNDLALQRWILDGGDMVATVNGVYYAPSSGRRLLAPDPRTTNRHVARDGIILRSLPATLTEDDVVPIHLYIGNDGDDRVVTTPGTAPEGYLDHGWQGYVLAAPRAHTQPLYLHHGDSDTVTSIEVNLPDHTRGSVVGHVLQIRD